MIRILFFCCTAGVVLFVMMTAEAMALTDSASLIVVAVPCIFFAGGYLGFRPLIRAFGIAGKHEARSTGFVLQNRETLKGLRSLLCTCGAIGSLIALVQVLNSLSDADTFYSALALVVMTGLYGIILAEIGVAPMIGDLKIEDSTAGPPSARVPSRPGLSLLLVLMGFLSLGFTATGGGIGLWVPLINTKAILLVLGGGLSGWLFQHGNGVFTAFQSAWKIAAVEPQETTRAYQILRDGRNTFLVMGGIGFFMGTLGIFQNLTEPTKLGPAMSIAILSLLYSLILGLLICAPLMHRIGAQMGIVDATPSPLVHRALQSTGAMAPIVTTIMHVGVVLLSGLAVSALP
jgi:flagellar motor component MotA